MHNTNFYLKIIFCGIILFSCGGKKSTAEVSPDADDNEMQESSFGGNEYVFSQRSNFVDINNDGHLDAFVCHDVQPTVYYINDGDGNFTLNNSYFPQFMSFRAYHTEILDVNEDGYFDVYLGGHEFDSYGAMETIVLLGNKENKFSTTLKCISKLL